VTWPEKGDVLLSLLFTGLAISWDLWIGEREAILRTLVTPLRTLERGEENQQGPDEDIERRGVERKEMEEERIYFSIPNRA